MQSFYSSLVLNFQKFPTVHQVFKPRFNKEFFKRLTANLDQAEALVEKRCSHLEPKIGREDLLDLKQNSPRLVKLMEQSEALQMNLTDDNRNKYNDLMTQLRDLEDRLMPLVVKLPNRVSKLVPETETVIEEVKSDFMAKEGLTKVLNHTKLSYINSCYTKSVVGPNSHYYFGIGAKLQQGLTDFFTHELEQANFIPISGLCLSKSAVTEATNSRCTKNYMTDPCRVLQNEPKPTTVHLTEASREALVGFITTIGTITSNNPLRLMCNGAGYHTGVDWFDPDTSKVSQFDTVHLLSFAPSIESYSLNEYHLVKDIVWNTHKKLGLPSRLVHCSVDTMQSHEFDAHRIDVWIPSQHDWVPTGRISHYSDFSTVRMGLKRGHMIDATTYTGSAIAAAVIENNQTRLGKFIIPQVVEEHMIALTENERRDYFRTVDSSSSESSSANQFPVRSGSVLHNLEQRRYFSRKNYRLGHSKEARNYVLNFRYRYLRIAFGMVLFLAPLIDWEECWIKFIPTRLKRILYDNAYRPCRRFWWSITTPPGGSMPKDESFDEMDKSWYDKTIYQRRKEVFHKYNPEKSATAKEVYDKLVEINKRE